MSEIVSIIHTKDLAVRLDCWWWESQEHSDLVAILADIEAATP